MLRLGLYSFDMGLKDEVRTDVCDRWLYVDSVKVLEKWGLGCHFFGFGHEEDIDALEALLEGESKKNPGCPPIMCLFTEFPSNPLLRSPNLRRLRALADKYEFLIVVDETIGNFVNVEVMPYADIVVSSLTKVFSGDANVMGGRFVTRGCGYICMRCLTFGKSLQPCREPSGSILPCLEGPAFVCLRRHVLRGGCSVHGTQFSGL